jgi:RNA polymerase sigma-B factor
MSLPTTRERSHELFVQLVALPADDPARGPLREQLAALHTPLARSLTRRFTNRGEPSEDLQQVAMLGLVKAIDRYDPERGAAFTTFATPTVLGELRRHFRDTGWAVHVPRGLQEARAAVQKAVDELSTTLERAPNASEIATHLGISREQVLEALEVAEAYASVPLEGGSGDDSGSPAATLGALDQALAQVEDRAALRPLLAELGEREQRILYLRFFEERSQSQIAAEVGISQMHVSRLLARTLTQLREGMHAA